MENVFKDHADCRLLINEELKKIDRKVSWLAHKAKCSKNHLGLVLKYERILSLELLESINNILETDFV
jgi:hypothetical protein